MPLLQAMADRHAAASLMRLGLLRDLDPPERVMAFLAERSITDHNVVVHVEAR
jgi:hypothetical protein